jgi:hypothetical protein
MTLDAFVSYAARDSAPTHPVCSRLTALGIRLWLDTEDLRRSRDPWRRAVQKGIAQSRALLVVLSEHWDESPACRYELAVALERHVPLVAMSLADRPGPIWRSSLLPAEAQVIDGDGNLTGKVARVAACLAGRRRVEP